MILMSEYQIRSGNQSEDSSAPYGLHDCLQARLLHCLMQGGRVA